MATDVLLAGVAAVLGGGMTMAGQWFQSRRQHRHDAAQDLRKARREAHQELIREAHLAGHYVARMTPEHPSPMAKTPENLSYIDSEVLPRIWQVQLLSESTQAEVQELMLSLYRWRDASQIIGARFEDSAYSTARTRFREARAAYINSARRELLEERDHH